MVTVTEAEEKATGGRWRWEMVHKGEGLSGGGDRRGQELVTQAEGATDGEAVALVDGEDAGDRAEAVTEGDRRW
jgi:hypothetical protein